MDIMEFREYCLSMPLAEECTPFDDDVLVYKIGGKMFAYISMSGFEYLSLKSEPEKSVELKENYPEIGRGIHTASDKWISVNMRGGLRDDFIRELIAESYRLVVEGITPKAKRLEIKAAIEEFYYQTSDK